MSKRSLFHCTGAQHIRDSQCPFYVKDSRLGGMPPSPGKDGKMTIKEDMREKEGRNKASPLLSARKTDKEKEIEPLGSAIV